MNKAQEMRELSDKHILKVFLDNVVENILFDIENVARTGRKEYEYFSKDLNNDMLEDISKQLNLCGFLSVVVDYKDCVFDYNKRLLCGCFVPIYKDVFLKKLHVSWRFD